MINVTVSGNNAEEILEQLTGLVSGALPTDTSWQPVEYPRDNNEIKMTAKEAAEFDAEAKKVAHAKPKKSAPVKSAPNPKKAAPKKAAPKTPEPGLDSGEAPDDIDKPTLQKKMKDLLDAGHRDDLANIFKEHGAKKFSELDSTQYGVVYDEIEALL